MSTIYSSQLDAYWYALPTTVKNQFRAIASKGDWTSKEAFDHLVPDGLKDNPQEVVAWMDGDPSLGIVDKDVSRIVSGENGGEYSVDNTIMEDMSVNRARGAADMTASELEATVDANLADESIIEAAYEGANEAAIESAEVLIAPLPEATAFSEVLGNVVPPIILAMKAGRAFSDDPDEQAGAAFTVGTIASVGMFTPAAPVIGAGALIWSLWGLGKTAVQWATR